jgi:hypothetical protein
LIWIRIRIRLRYYFLKVHLHHFPKIKCHKESQNSRNQCFSYYFCFMIEGSGSISLTNGSGFGSGRPTNIWIRIRNTGTNNAGIASAAGTPTIIRTKPARWVSGRKGDQQQQNRLCNNRHACSSKIASHNMDTSIGSGASKIRYDSSSSRKGR